MITAVIAVVIWQAAAPVRAADAPAASAEAAGGTGPPPTAAIPFWQAPALPTAVIQGGAIPPGWQPQAVPYQGVGPDGRPITMYFAPTYVFTYQSGPPVLAAPAVNRRQAWGAAPVPAATASGWNYRTSGAPPVTPTLPPATVARYQPTPYQFPPDARALAGTPIVPPAGLPPAAPALPAPPPAWAAAPAPTASPAPPPDSWVPADVPPPPGLAPQQPVAPPPGSTPAPAWGPAAPLAPVAAGAAAGAAAGLAASPAPTAALAPPPLPPPPVATPAPAATAAAEALAANRHRWRVVGVYDGDTVTCLDENNQQQKIRLAEIDAPESGQDYGRVSRDALAGMVFGKTIDVVDDGRDRYGRWIGHLYVDGVDVNRQMVAMGNAWHYAAYSKDPSLGALQAQAQAQRIGLWSQPNPVPPWEYRKNGKKNSS